MSRRRRRRRRGKSNVHYQKKYFQAGHHPLHCENFLGPALYTQLSNEQKIIITKSGPIYSKSRYGSPLDKLLSTLNNT